MSYTAYVDHLPVKFQLQCVCCFVLLYRYWGIVTVPGSIPYGSRPSEVKIAFIIAQKEIM